MISEGNVMPSSANAENFKPILTLPATIYHRWKRRNKIGEFDSKVISKMLKNKSLLAHNNTSPSASENLVIVYKDTGSKSMYLIHSMVS